MESSTAHGTSEKAKSRLVVVSVDSHVCPDISVYRPYCEAKYLDELDRFIADVDKHMLTLPGVSAMQTSPRKERYYKEMARYCAPEVNVDMATRIGDMDADGVAVEVVYHGGLNLQPIPFFSPDISASLNQDIPSSPLGKELRAVGIRLYNRWLAEWIQQAPQRFIALAHIPAWDIEASLEEVKWAHRAGLRGVNLPSPRVGLDGYNQRQWDPLWSLCSDLGLALHTHGGGGEMLSPNGPGEAAIRMTEVTFVGRRGFTQMVFGGVFERFSELKLILAEQSGGWIVETLRTLDSAYLSPHHERRVPFIQEVLPRLPSEYFRQNCYMGGSFLARYEAEDAIEHDHWRNVLWGRDYPHPEGTWPYTRASMRSTFGGLEEVPVRAMLGENAFSAFGLDEDVIRAIANRIGPTWQELGDPVAEPPPGSHLSFGFRKVGSFA